MTSESPIKPVAKRPLPDILQVPWGIWDAVVMVCLWFGIQIGLGVWLGVVGNYVPAVDKFVNSPDNITASFVLYLIQVLVGLGLVWVYARKYHVSWQALGWRRVSVWRTLGYIVAIFIGFIALATLALYLAQKLVPGFDANQAQTNDFTKSAGQGRSLALIALVLLPPIFEETIFRGFIFPAFAKRTGVFGGALISSVLFGLAHGQANLFVYTSILGLLLCFLYLRTRSIVPGILVHMINNYLAFLAIAQK